MTAEDYQQQITLRIKDNLNQWLAKLQAEKPELLLTRQWQVPVSYTHLTLPTILRV